MAATLKTVTLGCKVNQYETELVREAFLKAGFRLAERGEPADICVVNTCTVTSEGDSKCRQAIRRLARDHPDARILVMGCYATRASQELAVLPGVAEVVADRRELADILGRFGVFDLPNGISDFGNRSRAYVKVQDGCMLRCSYCIVPKVRPRLSSRPIGDVVEEVHRLLDNGYRELVLTGVHLGHYGVDWNRRKPKSEWVRLSDLVREIVQIEGDFRIRLSSLEATEVTRELVEVMADSGNKVCPHLHLCLQSGSDSVLRRMRRRWSAGSFVDRCHQVQEALDQPAFTTDVIVGFPGETEEDFEKTCQVVREVGFSKIHVFPFSPREGTPAAEMPNMIPKRIKNERSRRLSAIERELRTEYFENLIGRNLRVLVESPSASHADRVVGTSCRYAPVELPGGPQACGNLVDVVAKAVADGRYVKASPLGTRRK